MRKSSVLACICVLCALLAVSLTANLYQLCSTTLFSNAEKPASEVASVDREKAPEAAKKEQQEVVPVPMPVPTTNDDAKNNGTPYLIYSRCNNDFIFDDMGLPVCNSIVAHINGLSAEQTDECLNNIKIIPSPYSLNKITFSSGKMYLQGHFNINEEYVVHLPAGMNTDNGPMTETTSFIMTPDRPECMYSFKEKSTFYPVKLKNGKVDKCTLAIDLFGVEKIKVTVYKMPGENFDVAGFLSVNHDFYYYRQSSVLDYMYKVGEKTFTINNANRRQTLALDLVDMLEGLEPGMYNVSLSAEKVAGGIEKNYWSDDLNWIDIILSNMGVSLVDNRAGDKIAVFVRSLDSLEAVSGASVRVFTKKRVLIAKGETGKDGSVLMDCSGVDDRINDGPAYVVVEKDGDLSVMEVNESNTLSNADFGNTGRVFEDTDAFIYTERGIYRPGEEVNVSAFVRQIKDAEFAGKTIPCEITLFDSRGNKVARQAVMTNEDGFVTTVFKLAEYAPGGVYTASCGIQGEEPWGQVTFNVGAFVPDRIKVKLESEKDVVYGDEKVKFQLSGQYYFGKKLTNGNVVLKIYDNGPATVPHWKDNAVGMASDNNENDNKSRLILAMEPVKYTNMSEMELFASGLLKVLSGKDIDVSVPRRLSVVAEVSEVTERNISDKVDIVLCSQKIYLGMKYDGSKGGDAAISCKLLAYDKEQQNMSSRFSFPLTLRRKEWKYLIESDRHQSKRVWREVVVQEEKLEQVLNIDSDGAVVTLKDLPAGHYELEASDGQERCTVLDFWHWYGDGGSTRSANPSVLTVEADAPKYVPGSVARISFNGSRGVLLVAAGEKSLSDVRVLDTVDGINEVEISVPANVIGDGYFVALSHIKYDSSASGQEEISRNYALLRIPVDQSRRRLDMSVKTVSKAEPGEEIEIAVTLPEGNTLSGGTVQIFAVDEGILSLTDYETPDIFKFFHGKYYCDFTTSDIYSQIFSREAMRAPRKIGGDGAITGIRMEHLKNRKSAIVALPAVRFENGTARVKMKLPDHTGAMRIMAVAAAGERSGAAFSEVRMREKAGVLPLITSIAAAGDRFEGMFKVFNHEYEKSDAVLSVKCGKGLRLHGTGTKRFSINKGATENIKFDFSAVEDGAHSIEYTLEIGGRSVSGEEYVNVRASQAPVTDSRIIVLKPGRVYVPEGVKWKKLYESKASVSIVPSIGAKDSMAWLNEYPYGCLEQTVSCAFPLLAADRLAAQDIINPVLAKQSDARIEDAVRRVLSMLRTYYGFAEWPGSKDIWHEASIFAAHFLALVKTPYADKKVYDYVKYFLRNNVKSSSFSFNRAYSSYVLALMGDNFGAKSMLNVYQKKDAVPDMGMFMAGASLVKAGYTSEGLPLVHRALENKAWRSCESLWYFSSEAMRLAMALSIAMEILPENEIVTEMAMELLQMSRNDGSGWGVTGTNAWAVYGLSAYSAKYSSKPGEVRVTRNGVEEMRVVSGSIDVDNFDRIENIGNGNIILKTVSRGIPLNAPSGGSVEISKTYLDENGAPVSKVKCGDLVTVRIKAVHAHSIENAVLVDLLPGGFAIESSGFATRNNIVISENKGYYAQHSENLQDRFLLFMTSNAGGCTVSYSIRAVTPGEFAIPGISMEDMYDPSTVGRTFPTEKIIIEK